MSKTIRAPKQQGANVQLREALKRLEGRVGALETALREQDGRLAKVEVVKAGPQDPAIVEPDPQEPQRPETE
jgi:hypothetical protein